jgi:hypothetical protein
MDVSARFGKAVSTQPKTQTRYRSGEAAHYASNKIVNILVGGFYVALYFCSRTTTPRSIRSCIRNRPIKIMIDCLLKIMKVARQTIYLLIEMVYGARIRSYCSINSKMPI